MKMKSASISTVCLSLGVALTLSQINASFAEDTLQSSGSSSVSKRTVIESSSSKGENNPSASGSSSSSSEVHQSGVMGIRQSNKFAPKYKERIETYKNQIELGLTKGWLSKENAEKFSVELKRLSELEASVAAKGYVKADVDDIDKQLTKFNMDFTNAGQQKAAPAVKPTETSSSPAKPTEPASANSKAPATADTKTSAKAASSSKSPAKTAGKTTAKSAIKPAQKTPVKK